MSDEEGNAVIDDEPEGGDSPCWAHLFDKEPSAGAEEMTERGATPSHVPAQTGAAVVVDLAAQTCANVTGAVWTHQSEDLNVNLLVFPAGEGVGQHVNSEVDVLLVGIAGEGIVEINGMPRILRVGQALIIPKGASRATRSRSNPFAYLSCHRRRPDLWPAT